jgi:glutamine amidotransferase
MIGIVDYGMGNLRSVQNALDAVEAPARLISEPEEVAECDRIVLPGVGAFAEAIQRLREEGVCEALEEHVRAGKPLLGICLGMQLICARSLEDGEHEGFGWIQADVVPFDPNAGVKVPHMGWNSLTFPEPVHPIMDGVAPGADVYFVHSYHAVCREPADAIAIGEHGGPFTAALARDNVIGLQFHPEKSQRPGLTMLANFLRWIR